MRRVDLILYAGILILLVGLISFYFVSSEEKALDEAVPAPSAAELEYTPADEEASAERTGPGGWIAVVKDGLAGLRREGDQLATTFWKDRLSDGQRALLSGMGQRAVWMREFALSGQFLLILLCTGVLLGLYHLGSRWKKKATPSSRRTARGGGCRRS